MQKLINCRLVGIAAASLLSACSPSSVQHLPSSTPVTRAVSSNLPSPSAASLSGRYIGTLKHDRLGREQLAKLELIPFRNDSSSVQLRAILTLHFGGFDSAEYIAYHFDNVRFDLLSGILSFDQVDQEVMFKTETFANGILSGKLRAAFVGDIGELVLHKDEAAQPSSELVGPLHGDYTGSCQNQPALLRLETFRSTEETFQVGNPFGAYQVIGSFSQVNSRLCPADGIGARPFWCVTSAIKGASYNYFTSQLVLFGSHRNFHCRVNGNKLSCDDCSFQRVDSASETISLSPRQAEAAFNLHKEDPVSSTAISSSDDLNSIGGQYEGYVHNEFLDEYQRASMNLITFHEYSNGNSLLKLSAVANLHFGDPNKNESLFYHFDEITYPNPLLSPQFVLSRPGSDVDAVARITSIAQGVIKGEWFSTLFGRVGTFEMRKDGLPSLPAQARILQRVEGVYKNGPWNADLTVGARRSPINSNNPFYPLKVEGFLQVPGVTQKFSIEQSSYDFYTGHLALVYDNGSAVVGERYERGALLLRRASNRFGTLLQDDSTRPYTLVRSHLSEED